MQPTVVPPGLKAQAREGVDACPERAILIEER
jgi:ferredoxin